jgi:hypothetical protein
VALFCVSLLAACSAANERSARFADFAVLKTSSYADELPATLVPLSGRDIRVVYHVDSTDIDANFFFDRADAEGVIAPFRSPEQVRLHELERAGQVPPGTVANPLFVRCRDWGVEYLQVNAMTSAHYWTSHDPQLRKVACKIVPDGPVIAA